MTPGLEQSYDRVPQPDGAVLLKPGKIVADDRRIRCGEAATMLGMSERWVRDACQGGRFKTAQKTGNRWTISISEIRARRSGQNQPGNGIRAIGPYPDKGAPPKGLGEARRSGKKSILLTAPETDSNPESR